MYKIAVVGDYDSIYGFATLGLGIFPVKDREETKDRLRQLAEGDYGIIYITEKAAAELGDGLDEYREKIRGLSRGTTKDRKVASWESKVRKKLGDYLVDSWEIEEFIYDVEHGTYY